MHWLLPVLPFNSYDFSYLVILCSINQSLCSDIMAEVEVCYIYSVPRRCTPLSLWWLPIFSVTCVICGITFGARLCLELGRLLVPLSNIFVKSICLRQKGDLFWHYHCIVNYLPSWPFKLPPLFELVDEVGEGLCRVVRPHNLYCIFLTVDFVNLPVGIEQML